MELHPLLHLDVVAIEKGAFESLATKVLNFTTYKTTKAVVLSPDGDTYTFNIVTVVLQRDTLAPYSFILCLDYILWTFIDLLKENVFLFKKLETDNSSQ